jgi:head-tail adaptor
MSPLQPPAILPVGAVRVIDRLMARDRRDVCTIQRPVAQEDEAGATMESSWYTVAVVSCEVMEPTDGSESQIAGRSGPQATHAVSVPRTTDIRSSDRVIVQRTGSVLEVVYSTDDHSSGLDIVIQAVKRG